MTDAPQGRAQRFFAVVHPRLAAAGLDGYGEKQFLAVVVPLLEDAGYRGRGAQIRLSKAVGISPGTASRLMRQQTVPDIDVFPALAKLIDMTPLELLVLVGRFPEEELQSQEALSETKPSQVGSKGITPEQAAVAAAEELGFHDDVRKAVFVKFVESLKYSTPDTSEADRDNRDGGAAAQQM